MKSGFGNIMKQAQEMQENLKKVQEEIARAEVTGEAGAGLVKVTMTGKHDVRKVEIDKSLVGDDVDMLEDLGHEVLAPDGEAYPAVVEAFVAREAEFLRICESHQDGQTTNVSEAIADGLQIQVSH